MRSNTPVLMLLFVSWLLPGCTMFNSIEMSGDPAAIPPFRTFAIHDEQFSFPTPVSEEQRARISGKLRGAAVEALKERGYHEASEPDVFVTLGAISTVTFDEEKARRSGGLQPVDTSVLDTNRGEPVPTEANVPLAGVGREGDLVLYLLDPQTKRTIWRASASGSATTPAEAERKAKATYRSMVRKLPKAPEMGPE